MKRIFLIPLPAILTGSAAMYAHGLPMNIWIMNIIGYVIAVVLSRLVIQKPEIIDNKFTIPFSILILMLTFLDSGLENIHRWITVGPVRLYIASIVLPVLIIKVWAVVKTKNWWIAAALSIAVSFLLLLQPDASQATAFIIAVIIILFLNTHNKISSLIVLGILLTVVVFSWRFLDHLAPVSYVEDIMTIVKERGIFWYITGIISLIILPLSFSVFIPHPTLISTAVGTYFAVILISTLFGNFPVPLMGYGISPVLGYFISAALLINPGLEARMSHE